MPLFSDAEEIHRAFLNENQTEETESGDMGFPENDKINMGFCQASNYHEWQVALTESFYSAFMENDNYKLFIADASGIQVFILDSSEEKAVRGIDARNLLED